VRQNIRYVHETPCKYVLVLSGDQLYRMDFAHLLATHRKTGADVTIAALPVRGDQTPGFGILKMDETGRVTGFIEKPQTPDKLAPYHVPDEWLEKQGIEAAGRNYVASMGIYLFSRDVMFHLLNAPPLATDFGKEIFPRSIHTHRVHAHLFDGYWEDVGTIQSYHEANLALTREDSPFDFHAPEGLIYTRMRYLPASVIAAASVEHCMISDGCRIGNGTTAKRCVIGVRTQIGRNVRLRDSVLIGADRFETVQEKHENSRRSLPNIGVGDGTVIENAILDKDCRVGSNVRIVNKDKIQDGEGPNFVIREGIVVIPKSAVILDDTVI
jgi:glucose-1-phosphate adenylyltransferase